MENPRALSFDEQARQVFGMAPPPPASAGQVRALATLNRLLPGRGDVTARLAAWRARFVIPEGRRKAVFLREAVRELGLRDADVETSRFEELLPRAELHEALDLVSIRAVRIETRTLNTLQAFLRPGGKLLLFRGSSKSELEDSPPPPLAWMATYPLVDSLHSKLIVLSKSRV